MAKKKKKKKKKKKIDFSEIDLDKIEENHKIPQERRPGPCGGCDLVIDPPFNPRR